MQINNLNGKDGTPALLVDAGNLLFKQPAVAHSQELLTASGLMEIYQQMAYDAVAVGPLDLAAGVEFLKNRQSKGFPWLSANLTDKSHAPLFPAVKVVTRGDMKIGIIGLTGQPAASQEAIVADWRQVLPPHLTRLTKECQMVIALSSLTGEENAELTRQFPEIHVLITADRQQGNLGPKVEHSTLVAQTMYQGKYLGVLNIDWIPGSSWTSEGEEGRQITSGQGTAPLSSSFAGNFIALGKNLAEDPQITTRIEQIKQQISRENQQTIDQDKQQKASTTEAFSGLAGFVRCRECHPVQATFWNTTKHALAYATLRQQQQNFNLDCLPCHITRNPVPEKSGAWPVDALLTLPPVLQSVGCEACHGAGLAHADAPDKFKLRKKVEEKTCLACHNKERDPSFDYRQKSPKVSCPAG